MLVALVVVLVSLRVSTATRSPSSALNFDPFTPSSLHDFRFKYARFIEDELLDYYENLTKADREELSSFYNEFMIQQLKGADAWKTGLGLMEENRPRLWEQLVPYYEELTKKIDDFNMNTKFYWVAFVVRITLTDSPHLSAHYMNALGMLGEDYAESMHHKIRTDIQKKFPKLVFFLESQTFRTLFPPDPEKIRQRRRKGGVKGLGLKPMEYGDEVLIPFNNPSRRAPNNVTVPGT